MDGLELEDDGNPLTIGRAGLDVRADELYAFAKLQIVIAHVAGVAHWDDVVAPVTATLTRHGMDVCAYRSRVRASERRTFLATGTTEMIPMIQPRTAGAGAPGCPTNVSNGSHLSALHPLVHEGDL